MPKLFDILDAAQQQPVPTPAQVARDRWYQIASNVRRELKYGIEAMAQDCATLGKTAILAEMPSEVATQFAALLPVVQALWEGASDAVPFPAMPDDPVPPPDTTPADSGSDTVDSGNA